MPPAPFSPRICPSCAREEGCCSSRRKSAASRPIPPTSPSPTTPAWPSSARPPASWCGPAGRSRSLAPRGGGSSTTSSSSTRTCPPALRAERPPHPPRLPRRRHAVAHRTQAAPVDVVPGDRHLRDGESEALGARQHLHVEREPDGDERLEQRWHHVGPEGLQAALRVGQAREAAHPQADVEQPPAPAPPERL